MYNAGKTKTAIFETAVTLFAQDGYHRVSMKQIADAVGIAPPSIYNHYSSKESILTSIYKYFDDKNAELKPDLDELLTLCETLHPHEVMRRTIYVYPDEIKSLIYSSMLVTASMMHTDMRADDIIRRILIEQPYVYDMPLLKRMQELDRIEPMNIQHFALVHSCYCYSSAVRFYSNQPIDTEDWRSGLDLIFQLIKPTAAAGA